MGLIIELEVKEIFSALDVTEASCRTYTSKTLGVETCSEKETRLCRCSVVPNLRLAIKGYPFNRIEFIVKTLQNIVHRSLAQIFIGACQPRFRTSFLTR